MNSPAVLALDIALRRTGWAVGWLGMQRPFWGVHETVGDWDGREGEHLHAWRRFLEARFDEHAVTCIAMELPWASFSPAYFERHMASSIARQSLLANSKSSSPVTRPSFTRTLS